MRIRAVKIGNAIIVIEAFPENMGKPPLVSLLTDIATRQEVVHR